MLFSTAFNNQENSDKCPEPEEKETVRLTYEQAKAIIELYSGCRNVAEFKALPKAEQEKILKNLKIKVCLSGK